MEKTYTVAQISIFAQVDGRMIYREIAAGRLEAFRIGRVVRVTEKSYNEWLSMIIVTGDKK